MLILLDSELEDYAVPSLFYHGSINDQVQQLPITLKVQHIHHRVLKLEAVDTAEAGSSSLDTAEDAESLDLIEAAEALDVENTEA